MPTYHFTIKCEQDYYDLKMTCTAIIGYQATKKEIEQDKCNYMLTKLTDCIYLVKATADEYRGYVEANNEDDACELLEAEYGMAKIDRNKKS